MSPFVIGVLYHFDIKDNTGGYTAERTLQRFTQNCPATCMRIPDNRETRLLSFREHLDQMYSDDRRAPACSCSPVLCHRFAGEEALPERPALVSDITGDNGHSHTHGMSNFQDKDLDPQRRQHIVRQA